MNFLLRRTRQTSEETGGELYNGAGNLIAFTLEDEYRSEKVFGETRIPAGMYQIKLRRKGRVHEAYRKRFGDDWHKGTLELQGVEGFKYVLIHIGNTDDDTAGCILIGLSTILIDDQIELRRSEAAYKSIYPGVRDHLLDGGEVWIQIEDC